MSFKRNNTAEANVWYDIHLQVQLLEGKGRKITEAQDFEASPGNIARNYLKS